MGNEEVDLVTVVKPDEKRSLLQKYDIPVERLSYEYVARCSNVKEVEHIVLILRSGEEGIFPDLIKHAEKCLAEINPNSKILRIEEPVLTREMLDPEERKIIDEDMAVWMNEMQGREKDLEEGKALSLTLPIPEPEIRQTSEATVKPRRLSGSRIKGVKQKSIGSCDYSGWDKFDADAELDRMDLQDERNRVEVKEAQKKEREKFESAKKMSKESVVKKLTLTATELAVMSEQEKNIGNEAYRAGDYDEALVRYDSSIKINSTTKAYNNRAITNIKLGRYRDAVNDCNAVLSMEYDNVTALMRRGLALENVDKKSEALVDYQTILRLEPNNKIAIAGVNKLRNPSDSKKVRIKIEEEEDNAELKCGLNAGNEESARVIGNEESNDFVKKVPSEICFCDRAPGFSRNPKPPPHYKSSYCLPMLGAVEKREIVRSSKSQDSYFPEVAINRYDNTSRKLIIEELPSNESELDRRLSNDGDKPECRSRIGKKSVIGVTADYFVEDKMEKFDKKIEETEKLGSESRQKVSVSSRQEKIEVANKYEKSVTDEKITAKVSADFLPVESPYEFLHTWQSLKNDVDLSLRAKLLRSLAPEDLDAVIGNKLDGNMLSVILRCLERHFCTREEARLIHRFITALTKLRRFSIVHLFMDFEDKKVLKTILNFIDDVEGGNSSTGTAGLREAWNV